MRGKLVVVSLLAVTLFVVPREAAAQIPPAQWQVLALGSGSVELDRIDGQVQLNASLYGLGLALGLGGGVLPTSSGPAGTGFVDLAIQLRPLMIAAAFRERWLPPYAFIDPHIDVGGQAGFASVGSGASFRGNIYVGASVDLGIPLSWYPLQAQLLLTVGYRLFLLQSLQDSQPALEHCILAGIGFRAGL